MSPKTAVETDLVVLGAGPAGVAAAFRAARAGHRVVVLERSFVPGGLAGSFAVDGIRVDYGSHRLHSSADPAILATLRELLGDELEMRSRNGRIRLAGRWIAFPLRASDLVRRLPPSFAAAALLDTATTPLRRARKGTPDSREDTFAGVLHTSLGPTMCERFYFPYARKIWGAEPSELSGEQARRRVSAGSPVRLLRRVLRGAQEGRSTFFYPRGGFGRISEALASAATAAGAELHYGQTVTGVEVANNGVRVETDTGTVVEAGRAWSTLPATVLARLVRSTPEPVLAAANRLKYRAMLLVYLLLEVDRYTPFDAHYLPEPSTPVTRVSEPKNYRSSGDPSGRTVLCAELPCAQTDKLWRASDEALGRTVVDGLTAVGLPQVHPRQVTVRRIMHAYPIYRAGCSSAFAMVDAWAGAQPRLLLLGRQGLFAHVNTHHALAMAWAAADALQRDGTFDEAAWAIARDEFAGYVVED
jgi:protoporphyrinogen oxidase